MSLKKTAGLFLVLMVFAASILSMVKTPLLADDFGIAMSQSFRLNETWFDQFLQGIESSIYGTHFNALGQVISNVWVKAWIEASVFLGLDLHVGFWILKTSVFGLSMLSIVFFLNKVFKIQYLVSSLLAAVVFSSTIQIHTPWSNDPVTNFTLAGYFSTSFALIAMSIYVVAIRSNSTLKLGFASAINLVAISMYEINFSVIVFQIVVWLYYVKINSLSRSQKLKTLTPILSAIVFVWLYRVFGARSDSSYGGTTIAVDGSPITTLAWNLISSLPGSAWRISTQFISLDQLSFKWLLWLFTSILLASLAVTFALRMAATVRADSPNRETDESAILVGLVLWSIAATAIQSLTQKVQAETTALGYVYTFYASTSVAFILVASYLLYRFSRKWFLMGVVGSFISSAMVVQMFVNLQLNNWLWSNYGPNVALVSVATRAFDADIRCQHLNVWLGGSWPEYYELETTKGLDLYSKEINGEQFCPS